MRRFFKEVLVAGPFCAVYLKLLMGSVFSRGYCIDGLAVVGIVRYLGLWWG